MAQNGTDKKGITPASAGLAGAVVGAAVGAAAVALTDKENRKKVQKAAYEIKKLGEKQFSRMKHYSKRAGEESKAMADDVKETASDIKDIATEKTDTQASKQAS